MTIEPSSLTIKVHQADVLDIALLCHSMLAQDSPEPPDFYVNQILNLATGYCSREMRTEIEEFLADKKYLPPINITLAK